jgi:cell division protein FtsA
MRGFGELAYEIFGIPTYKPEQPDLSGVSVHYKDPKYSTALGLIRYAQILDEERPTSMITKLAESLRRFWPFGN